MLKKYLELFLSFLKIGTITIGSGYAMIPIIEIEVVNKKKWISEEEFLDMLSLAQSCPGAISLNIAVFIGFRLAGFIGGIITIIGVILSAFLIMLFIAIFLIQAKDNPIVIKILNGLKPAICSLMIYTLIGFIKKAKTFKKILLYILIAIFVTFCVIRLNITPILFIVVTPILSILYFVIKEKIGMRNNNIDNKGDGDFLE